MGASTVKQATHEPVPELEVGAYDGICRSARTGSVVKQAMPEKQVKTATLSGGVKLAAFQAKNAWGALRGVAIVAGKINAAKRPPHAPKKCKQAMPESDLVDPPAAATTELEYSPECALSRKATEHSHFKSELVGHTSPAL